MSLILYTTPFQDFLIQSKITLTLYSINKARPIIHMSCENFPTTFSFKLNTKVSSRINRRKPSTMSSTEENSFEQNIVEQLDEDFSRKRNRDEVAELADPARLELMPALSRHLYFMAHNKYDAWCIGKK